MRRGFSVPIVMIFIGIFLIIPLVFYYILINKSSQEEEVRGVVFYNHESDKGLVISINSNQGPWDLHEYLCENKEVCLESLTSGRKWGTVSGGNTNHQEIFIEYSDDWVGYEFMKLYLKSGWGSTPRTFEVVERGEIEGIYLEKINQEGSIIPVVLIPVSDLSEKLLVAPAFSDN